MIIPVHMFAFANEGDRSKVRQVEIPQGEAEEAKRIEELLELVFYYGQNDFQPKRYPSVSVGDVAEINGRYFMVMGTGWKEMTKEEFDKVPVPSSMYAYGISIKESAKGDE